MSCVYQNKKNILIFAGGISPSKKDVESFMINHDIDLNSSFIIAVDSGMETVIKFDLKADLLIGDMDSIDKETLCKFENSVCKKVFPKDKDFSDTELAFIEAKKIPHKNVVLIGASGGRIEHFVSLLSLLNFEKYNKSTMSLPNFWLTEENIIVFCNKKNHLQINSLIETDNISVFSLGKNFFKGKIISKGLKWNLDKLNWKKQISLSNRIDSGYNSVELSIKRGSFIFVLPLKNNIKIELKDKI